MRIEIVRSDGTRTTPIAVSLALNLQTSRAHVGFDWPSDLAPPAPGERVELELDYGEWPSEAAFLEW